MTQASFTGLLQKPWQSATDILGNTNNQAVVLRHEAVDVDNLSDWDLLETLYARQNRRMDPCVS